MVGTLTLINKASGSGYFRGVLVSSTSFLAFISLQLISGWGTLAKTLEGLPEAFRMGDDASFLAPNPGAVTSFRAIATLSTVMLSIQVFCLYAFTCWQGVLDKDGYGGVATDEEHAAASSVPDGPGSSASYQQAPEVSGAGVSHDL